MDSRADILSAMRTCKTFYRGGVPTLLERPVRLGVGSDEHASRFTSFYSFMMNEETGNRFQSLHHLLVYASGKIRGETSRMLIEIFQKAADHLQSLELPNCETLLSADDQDISFAISALRSLKSIKVSDGSERSLSLMRQFCFSLRNVDLSSISSMRNPMSSLFDLYPTIEDHPSFPHVQILHISDTYSYPMSLLVFLFPNLDQLITTTGCASVPIAEDDVDVIRHTNARRQQDISWRALEHLSGDCFDLFMMAVRCPVRVLEVHNVGSLELFMLAAIIRDTRPVSVRLRVDCRRFYLASFPALLRNMPNRLTMTFELDGTEVEVSTLIVRFFLSLCS